MKRANLPHENSGNLNEQVSVAREPMAGKPDGGTPARDSLHCNAGRPERWGWEGC